MCLWSWGRTCISGGDLEHRGQRGRAPGLHRRAICASPSCADPLQPGEHRGQHPGRSVTVHLVPGEQVQDHRGPQGLRQREHEPPSRMLKPCRRAWQGVKDFVLETVRAGRPQSLPAHRAWAWASAAPSTSAPLLAKQALLRPAGRAQPRPLSTPTLEQELLEQINATGIGPQGFGGAHHLSWALSIRAPCPPMWPACPWPSTSAATSPAAPAAHCNGGAVTDGKDDHSTDAPAPKQEPCSTLKSRETPCCSPAWCTPPVMPPTSG